MVVVGIVECYAHLHAHSSNLTLHNGVVVGPAEQSCNPDKLQHFDRDWWWSLVESAVDIDRVSVEMVVVN